MQPSRILLPNGPLRSWGLSLDALRILVALVALVVATLGLLIGTAYNMPMFMLPNAGWSSTMEDLYFLSAFGHLVFFGVIVAAYIHAAANDIALPAQGNVPTLLTPAWLVLAATCSLCTK